MEGGARGKTGSVVEAQKEPPRIHARPINEGQKHSYQNDSRNATQQPRYPPATDPEGKWRRDRG
jgi:hypothetical protein